MNKRIRALQARKAQKVSDMRAMLDRATADGDRNLTVEEQATFDKLDTEAKDIGAQVVREERLVAEEAQLGVLDIQGATQISGGEPQVLADPKRGFKTVGEFCRAVRNEGPNVTQPRDERLQVMAAAPTTFGSEGVGTDGGFAVPPDFSRVIWTYTLGEDFLLPLTDGVIVQGNSMVFPKDETVPWGTDGIRAYWQAEAAAGSQTKPKLSTTIERLYKLLALVPVTDELLADTDALSSYIPGKAGDSIRWKVNEAILWGLGNGTPLGAFQSNAVITIAKETSQATLTLLFQNLAKMIARLPPGSFGRSIWMINNDVLPAVMSLNNAAPSGVPGTFPVWMPFGAAIGPVSVTSPYGAIFTRPVMVSQHAKSFTNAGDVMLFDPYYVRSITKGNGIQSAMSLHLYFDADAAAFRFTFRVDAQPKVVNPIAPWNGANNLSPFLLLGAR